jgi:hypothetical protein
LILGKSQTDNCNGYRPASTFPEFLNFKRPCFACLNDLNGAKRLNGWNDWNGLRLRERVHFNAGNRGRHRQERALVMELLHRHSGLKQRMIAERLEILDDGLVSGYDRKAIRDKIETEPKM